MMPLMDRVMFTKYLNRNGVECEEGKEKVKIGSNGQEIKIN